MLLVDVFELIRRDPRLLDLARDLVAQPGPVTAGGLWGSCAPIVAAMLAEHAQRPLLLVTGHSDDADDFRDDIETATGTAPVLLPALEHLSGESPADDDIAVERLRLCMALSQGGAATPRMIVAPLLALMQPTPTAEAIAASALPLRAGQSLSPDRLAEWLDEQGFKRCDAVELPGDYARRGGILDIFSDAHEQPLRVEFFGEEIESIRLFDAGAQRSVEQLASVLVPARSVRLLSGKDARTTSFLSLLPAGAIIAFHEPLEIQELGASYWQRMGERAGIVTVNALFRRANDFAQLHLRRFAEPGPRVHDLAVGSLPQFEPRAVEALEALRELTRECDVIVLCDNAAEKERFQEILAEDAAGNRAPDAQAPPDAAPRAPLTRVRPAIGLIHRGFRWRDTAYVPHHELFHRYQRRRTLRRVQPARPIDSFFDLNPGDLVVHALHGIGRFRGLQALDDRGRRAGSPTSGDGASVGSALQEYLVLEFADQATVHVPISQIHVVQKYIGGKGRVALSRIGGTAWKRAKERVADAVGDLAAELLSIQAQRATQQGTAYPADTLWQREFEGSFIYTETEDQLRALAEIKRDMSMPRPMDRLICGDVGFGKTELAMRAAFKTIEYGKQVAVLVPTTVLAEQHYQTFRERLADYPFSVEAISRFRSKPEQNRIIELTKKGRVDVLIGTHRLLSSDVKFADLGLVIIDEEQRFGVDAKEKLKRLRSTVEVLTLSATPIPRTLHMSLLGIRDISSLASPPVDRRAIVTQVRMWDDGLLREAIRRELNRDGQVYFVHNFVRDIEQIANRVREITPEARVVVGHGQMSGPELEEVMLKFMRREADVLVSTNIIESGIDISTANTIFINRAERFGLADLHQLRGRVGRSKHRAYCYLLLSPKHPVNDIAARRLKAVEQYSQLGAGFQIAMRDLEIRGAGNMLGPEQSGHIEAVGYEMYCQLLEQAVRRMKNEPAETWKQVNLELGVTASIPRSYIRSDKQRMEVYKRLASAHALRDVAGLRNDLRDAFGPPPEDVETLLALAEIRVLSQPWGVRAVVLKGQDLIFSIDDLERVQALFADGPGSPRLPDAKTVHWRLPARLLKPPLLFQTLKEQLSRRAPEAVLAG